MQEYCKAQKQLGVLLTVCSKNEPENAKLGLSHPDSVLHDGGLLSPSRANWEPKDQNLLHTAETLSLLPESFVFVDDNPAERDIVSAQIPGIAVPHSTVPRTASVSWIMPAILKRRLFGGGCQPQ